MFLTFSSCVAIRHEDWFIKDSTSIKLEWDRERNFMLQQNELLISFLISPTMCSVSSEQLEWEQWMFPTYAPFNFCNLTRSNSKEERIPLSLRSLYCGKARRLRNYLKDTFNFSKETSFSNQKFFFLTKVFIAKIWVPFSFYFNCEIHRIYIWFIVTSMCVGVEESKYEYLSLKRYALYLLPKSSLMKNESQMIFCALALLPLTENFKALFHFFFPLQLTMWTREPYYSVCFPTTYTTRMVGSFGI